MHRFLLGLGNPGSSYSGTRHNLGFMLADLIAGGYGFKPGPGEFYIAETPDCLVIKPTTYMNRSGIAALQLAELFQLDPRDMLVAYDDVDLEFGTVRLRLSGSSGTHKGMESVIYYLGTERIPRIRMGIGPKPPQVKLADFVLSPFEEEEKANLPEVLEAAKECVYLWLKNPELASSRCGKVVLGRNED